MKKTGILFHPQKETSEAVVSRVTKILESRNVSTWGCSAWEIEKARKMMNGTDLLITVGGDGTILRAVQTVVPESVPITGINLGNLGFMTELSVEEIDELIPSILDGKGWIDERYLLEAQIDLGRGQGSFTYYALNDVVLARGSIARTVNIGIKINDEELTTYKCDGVIVATATGSTGYSLAAGGPILYRGSRDLLLVPVAPHLSAGYPLVLPNPVVVELTLATYNTGTLSIDGHANSMLQNGVKVTIRQSSHTVKFLRIHKENAFYSTLESKMKGKK